MRENSVFYYPYATLSTGQSQLLRSAGLFFDRLLLLYRVGTSGVTTGSGSVARDSGLQLKGRGTPDMVTSIAVLTNYERPNADAIRRDNAGRVFPQL